MLGDDYYDPRPEKEQRKGRRVGTIWASVVLAVVIGVLVWAGTTGSGGDASCHDPRSGASAC